jgi:prevent-host-death family protein
MDWKLAEAKNKFSEVVRRALTEGPQRVMRRRDTVVVLAESEYERLAGSRVSFKEFLLNVPDMDGLDLDRDKSPMRDVSL